MTENLQRTLPTYDVAIGGASLSGATSALLLAANGFRVALIEPRPGPKQKACGCGLSSRGVSVLRKLGVYDELMNDTEHCDLQEYRLYERGGVSAQSISLGAFEGVGIERLSLDTVLNRKIKGCPLITLLEGEQIKGVSEGADGFQRLELRNECIRARYVINATGHALKKVSSTPSSMPVKEARHSWLRRGLSLFQYEQTGMSAVILGEIGGLSPSTVHIFRRKIGCFFLTPVAPAKWNVSFVTHPNKRTPKVSKDLFLHELHNIIPSESDLIVQNIIGASHIGAKRPKELGVGILPVGDAYFQLDPSGGMGMTFALLSAEYIVNYLISELKIGQKNYLVRERRDAIQRGLNTVLRPLQRFTTLSALGLHSKTPLSVINFFVSTPYFQRRMAQFHSGQNCRMVKNV